jgi:FtsP/CotA-like multicopper oxidase with cupredoxin domain
MISPARQNVRLDRRRFLEVAGSASFAMTAGLLAAAGKTQAQTSEESVDHTIRIAPLPLEIAPGKIIKTTGYNGSVPGPALRLQEGKPVRIKVINDSGYPNLIHWHGLFIPSEQDGATEEGSPLIQPGQSLIYSFTPRPSGTRWYHSHAMAMTDLTKSTYSGEFGFLMVDPAHDPGRYDREILLASHTWEGMWVSMQDLRKGPPPDNGLEAMYHAATFGERMLGHGEPIRVREGERVLFRILNANASMGISLALPGHRFTVLALDGNPVPVPASVDVLKLDVAERADVIVEMNNPGVWVLGSTRDDDRAMGMGIVVEYADRRGEPQWIKPASTAWTYGAFARPVPATAAPDETIDLKFEKVPGGRGGYNRWIINGKSWPDTNPLFTVKQGKRYRLVMDNHSGDEHPVHLHRHTFEVTKIGDKPMSGLMKDTISLPRFSTAEIDFVADDPGSTLFHCHHQDHMDEGFAGLITYG